MVIVLLLFTFLVVSVPVRYALMSVSSVKQVENPCCCTRVLKRFQSVGFTLNDSTFRVRIVSLQYFKTGADLSPVV